MGVRSAGIAALVTGCLAWPAAATTVPPLTFRQIVAQASLVFTGEVVRTESRWVSSSAGQAIVTAVTFRIERLLKGEAGTQIVVEFLGGRVGETELVIDGVPKFAVGDRAVVCVDLTRPLVSPVVGLHQGWFPVRRQRDTGVEYTTTFDGAALPSVDSLGGPRARVGGTPARTMTRHELELEIDREVRGTRR